MHHLGIDGYRRLTQVTIDATRKMRDGIRAIAGLDVLGEPAAQILAIATAAGFEDRVDVFEIGDAHAATGLVPRPPGPARFAARDGQRRQRADDRRVPGRSRRVCRASAPAHAPADRATNYATLE